jgi:hypothetical protein
MPVAIKRDPDLFVTNEKMRDYYNWAPEVFLSRVVTVTPPSGGTVIRRTLLGVGV